jgi:hypothetical protein
MKFLKQEISAVTEWRAEVVEQIACVISDTLDINVTTLEQDQALAESIFDRLLASDALELPDGKLSPGGVVPIPGFAGGGSYVRGGN